MFEILTPAQLAAKGIYKKDVIRLLKNQEKLVTWYVNNDNNTASHTNKWDAACQRWDHMKATLNQF